MKSHSQFPSAGATSVNRLISLLAISLFLSPIAASARITEIADTGYRLTVPDHFTVSRPAGAPDILIQADRPDGNGTVQVVRANAHTTPDRMAGDYEGKMRQALGNLTLLQENMRTVAARSCLFRRYQSNSGGMSIRVQALFYADGNQGFIVHAIDTAGHAPEFEQALISLNAPNRPVSPSAGGWQSGVAAPSTSPAAGEQPLGQSGFVFSPPTGWQSTPAGQNPGLGFALPQKGAALEVTWLNVAQQTGHDLAAFLDQTLAELAGGFGPGWNERERTPHRNSDTQVLFKRYGGQINGQPAELMIIGSTDGQNLAIAYGYAADLGPNSATPDLRQAILSLKKTGGSANTASTTRPPAFSPSVSTASPPPPPSTGSGWGAPPAPSTTAPPSNSGGWGVPPAPTSQSSAAVPPPPTSGSRTAVPPPPTSSSPGIAPPPPAIAKATTPATTSSGSYQTVVVDDSGFEFNAPKAFAIAKRSEGQTQWADPSASGAKIVMVIQTMARSAGNSVDSVRDSLVAQVNGSSAAQLQSSSSQRLNGLAAHQLHFTLNRGVEPQHFRYVVLDAPGDNVATISFVAPASMANEAQQHYAEVLRTVRAAGAAAAASPARAIAPSTGWSSAPPPPTSQRAATPPAGPPEPSTSTEAYFALAQATAAQQWDWVIDHMTDKALQEFCRYNRNALPQAGLSEADALDDPTGTALAYLRIPDGQDWIKRTFEANRTIDGTREENADWHLVMTRKANGSQSYVWFKRIKGRWQFDY